MNLISLPSPFDPLKGLATCTRGVLGLVLSLLLMAGAQARSYTGLIYPVHDIVMSSGVSGLVMKRVVRPGQSVRENQLLLVLDDRLQSIESDRRRVIYEDQSELQASRERLRILTTLLQDSRAVFDRTGSVSKDELLRLEAEQLATQGRLAQLVEQKKRERLDHETAEVDRLQRHITSPINGVVTKILPQVGEWAKAGEPLLHLVDTSVAVLRLAVPHSAAHQLKVGAKHWVRLEANSGVAGAAGQITFVSPIADPASGLVQIEIHISNPGGRIKTGIKGSIELTP